MKRILLLWLIGFFALLLSHTAHAQSLEDLELRKKHHNTSLGFGFLGLVETSAGLNRDRPEVSQLLFVAPQLKIGKLMRLRLNVGVIKNWLDRQENPWDLTDVALQFSHLNLYTETWTGIHFSGYGRWYFPTSKASRNAGNVGQLRAAGKASRVFGPLLLSLELNAQKYFFSHATWDTGEEVGSSQWFHSAGLADYIDNNASYGLGQTFTATVSTLRGLDLSCIYGLYQSRAVSPDKDHSDISGSSYLAEPRQTGWSYSFRFVLDATYGLGALPWLTPKSTAQAMLSNVYLSLGYSNFAPQLPGDTNTRNLNPFNPKYASAYFDAMVLY